MYAIISGDKVIKKYPFKLQCTTWLLMHGWVMTGRMEWSPYRRIYVMVNPKNPDEKVYITEIEEAADGENKR